MLSAQINAFINHLITTGASKKTVENYRHYLQRFLDYIGDCDVELISAAQLIKYQKFLRTWEDPKTQKGLKKITQNYFLIALRSFLRYLQKSGSDSIKAELIKLTSFQRVPIKALSHATLERLLSSVNVPKKSGLRDRTLLYVLINTGLKVSDIVKLNREDIDLLGKKISIRYKAWPYRGVPDRFLKLTDQAVLVITQYLGIRKDTFKPLFIRFQGKVSTNSNGEAMRLTVRSVQRIVKKYAKHAGIPIIAITPHILRHSFANNLITTGCDVKTFKEKMGLVNQSSAKEYFHILYKHKENPTFSKWGSTN